MSEAVEMKKLLKGGEFIVKDSGINDVFIPEDIDEQQKMIKQMCKDFVKELGERTHQLEEQAKLMEETGDLGLLGTHIPESYGGNPMDTNTNTIIAEELGRAGGSFDTTFAAHTGIGMLPILYFGTDEQKKKYLPGLSSGELKAAYCLTEPGSGSDALAAKSRADLSEDGSHYIINGQKMWISNAGFADVLTVFAKIDGELFTGFIIESNSEGITLGEEEKKMGIKGSSTRQVFFENVKVPVENLLGEAGKGHLIAFNTLNIGRYKLGTMSMGGSKQSIDSGIQYANERHQFKRPISYFGAIQFKIAQQALLNIALESAVYRVSHLMQEYKAKLMAEGKGFEQAMLEAAKEYAAECAIIKVAGSEILDYTIDEMVQIYGGYGFSEEYPAARAYRDQRINRIYEGTNEINRMMMVGQIMKKAFRGEIDLVGPAWEVQKELAQMPKNEPMEGALAEERQAVSHFKKILLIVSGAAAKYQMDGLHDLKNEQEVMMNIADIAIDAFMAESFLIRVLKIKEQYPDRPHFDAFEAGLKVFIYDTQAKIVKTATDALSSFAKGDEMLIMLRGLKRFSKYPPQNVKELRRKVALPLIEANIYCY